MKVYLVGGAVRDKLLGLPIRERDWVVVGTTPDVLLAQGYKQVGRDFPVFLHPKTKEEYALARMEKKKGPGYYGFACDYSPGVSLEEDLLRRDLTINAMAMDEKGMLIDPYGGQKDLSDKLLRHVSPAFVEDPVRVLRVARFAARFYQYGFRLAEETRQLMYSMLRQGELDHLVAERVWQEWQRSLQEPNPEQFIWTLRACGALKVILPELDALFGVPNPQVYHPEIDTGVHSLLVLKAAVVLTNDPVTRFAALVHDLGKAITPMQEWPRHHGHEGNGVPVIEQLCFRLRVPTEYRKLAVLVSALHLSIHRLMEMRSGTIVKVLEQAGAFRDPMQFKALLLACQADAQGRGIEVDYQQTPKWDYILSECGKISAKELAEQGYTGPQIKDLLHQERAACVERILTAWKDDEK